MDISFEHAGREISIRSPDDDHIGKVVAESGAFYEEEMLVDLAGLLHKGECVIDVGANIGNHSIFFAAIAGCRVHAFEPNAEALDYLAHNVRVNALEADVTIHSIAVGATQGHVRLSATKEGNLGATRFAVLDEGQGIPMTTLDAEFLRDDVSLVKIDAEGMDFDVLLGAAALLRRRQPIIAIECQTIGEFADVQTWLSEYGYVATACYNATETYVFMPTATIEQCSDLLRFSCHQSLRLQHQVRDMRKVCRRVSRELGLIKEDCPPGALAACVEQVKGIEEKLAAMVKAERDSEDNPDERDPDKDG